MIIMSIKRRNILSNIDFQEIKQWMENLTEEDRQKMREEMKDGYLNFEEQKKNAIQNGVPMFSSKCSGIKSCNEDKNE